MTNEITMKTTTTTTSSVTSQLPRDDPFKEHDFMRSYSSSDTSETSQTFTASVTWLDTVEQYIRETLSASDKQEPLMIGICGTCAHDLERT